MSPSDALSSSSNPEGGVDRQSTRESIKRRSSRACDQCRRTKGRCDRKSIDETCSSCRLGNLYCTTSGPNLKRGPPKGYLRAVETNLHETEAVLGIILSVPDLRLRAILQSVAEDPFAQGVLHRVNNCPFGPANRSTSADQRNRKTLESPYGEGGKDGSSNPFTVGPTNAWQDYVVSKITANLGGLIPPEARQPLDFSSSDDRLANQALNRDGMDHIYSMPETASDGVGDSLESKFIKYDDDPQIDSPTESPADYNFDDVSPLHHSGGMGHGGESSSSQSTYSFGSLHQPFRSHFADGSSSHDGVDGSGRGHGSLDGFGLPEHLRPSLRDHMSSQSSHQFRRPGTHASNSGSGSSGSGGHNPSGSWHGTSNQWN